MVDAAGIFLPETEAGTELSPAVFTGAKGAQIHAAVCSGTCPTPAQHPDWVSNWIEHSGADTIVAALLDDNDRPVFSLPLEVVAANSVKMARFQAGPHANGSFPAIAADAPAVGTDALDTLIESVGRARPDVNLVLLERLASENDGRSNPFLDYPHIASPNPALAVTLEGGFDAVLARSNGKRKRKKHRSQTRKFDALGSWRRFRAETPAEARELVNAFFDMKVARFRQLGIQNTFADEGVRNFFRHLFANAAKEAEPSFVMHGIEVADKLRAVTGSSISGKRIVCEFSSFVVDDAASASPGDFLFFENIREACQEGMEIYDFSVGDEVYKRLWCDRIETQFDCFLPLNAKGKLAAMAYRTAAEAKRVLKSNDAIWQTAKKIRRTVAGG